MNHWTEDKHHAISYIILGKVCALLSFFFKKKKNLLRAQAGDYIKNKTKFVSNYKMNYKAWDYMLCLQCPQRLIE